ncbi:MAG: response regulator [Granulosicoccus sp.]
MTTRLLLVEPSATMRQVLERHARSLGLGVEPTSDYAQAAHLLNEQFHNYGNDFSGVLLGWPSVATPEADALAAQLESPAFEDLPVVVMSTDMRAETRAWVAGRQHTVMLPWKAYRDIDGQLKLLLDKVGSGEIFSTKFDNSDIHVLIVDDSVTIRFSLRDLFVLQGYRVSVAGTHSEAMDAARNTAFDIALLDYYLESTTGDMLCRELISDQATGDITCAVLTGTYADHIIKRSLRAGAVECMFKNESSELLLSRIDAISRFVRQRREMLSESQRLKRVIDAVAGSVLVLDKDRRTRHISQAACRELGITDVRPLIGQSAAGTLGIRRLPTDDNTDCQLLENGEHLGKWRDLTGREIDVVIEKTTITDSGDIVLPFHLATTNNSSLQQFAGGSAAIKLVQKLSLTDASEPLLEQMMAYQKSESAAERISLLLVDLFVNDSQVVTPAHELEGLADFLEAAMQRMYRREHHVVRLVDNRFAFLLRHIDEPQAYLLTRKIMQLCNDVSVEGFKTDDDSAGNTLASTGSLVSITAHRAHPAEAILVLAAQGLDIVNTRGLNQALLVDLKRMLGVYPKPRTSVVANNE